MERRSYNQFCPMACALDVLGDRWTLLIVRNLVFMPQRYTDLLEGLPGIPTDLLTARLKRLESEGVVRRRRLPPPAQAVSVYELTELGRGLERVVLALAAWGSRRLRGPRPGQHVQPAWFMSGLAADFRPERARDVYESYEFRIDDDVFHFRVDDGVLQGNRGPAPDPAVSVTSDSETFLAIGTRSLSAKEAMKAGRLVQEGEPSSILRMLRIFGMVDG